MPFESDGERHLNTTSPGGFQFGVQGWVWNDPKPTTITFFLDGTAMVCDQYGRQIRRAITSRGELRFADTPPESPRDGNVQPRPHFATHAQVIAALAEERINWQGYEVRYITPGGRPMTRGGLTLDDAVKVQVKLVQDGNRDVAIVREIVYAGWPQLPYDELKGLPELPPTPIEELRKIRDPQLRKDALRIRREADEAREKEMAGAADE